MLKNVLTILILSVSVGTLSAEPTMTPMPVSTYTAPSTYTPGPNCNGTQQVLVWRCVCRINLPLAGGGFSSIPLYQNGSSTIFTESDLSGDSCEGSFQADPCRPTLTGRANGTYSCIQGTTTSGGGFQIN